MRLPDSELSGVPTCLYGGASGAVGLVASLFGLSRVLRVEPAIAFGGAA